jgi:hypothetical protein
MIKAGMKFVAKNQTFTVMWIGKSSPTGYAIHVSSQQESHCATFDLFPSMEDLIAKVTSL